jgi:multidrug efflux system outer membrane protein
VRLRALVLPALVTGVMSCTVRAPYTPATVIPATQRVGVARISDSSRAFFDSLTAERRRDSARVVTVPLARQIATSDSLASVAWLDIIRDTTLVRLIDLALRQNRNVQIAVARITEYRANVGVARAAERPTVTLNGSQSRSQVALGAFPPASFNSTRLTADMAWEVDVWGRVRYGIAAAGADLEAQEAAERGVALSLVGDVAIGYLQLLELYQEVAIAERTLSSRKATLQVARERFAQGLTSELDVKQFEAQVAAPAVTLAQAERALAQTEHNLNVLLGQGPASIPRGLSLADAARSLTVPDSIPVGLLARRPDVQQAERNYAAATARVGAADAARWPTISLVGSLGTQARTPDDIFGSQSRVYQALAGISFPLFDNARLANVATASRARVEQARAAYEGVALNALREANDALTGVRASGDQAAAQATQANALRQALELADLRYQAGLASYLDLLDAQRSLFNAELALSQAQLGQLVSAVQLYWALGGSWPRR